MTAESSTDAIWWLLSNRVNVDPMHTARTVKRPGDFRMSGLGIHFPFPVRTVVVPPFTRWIAYSPSFPTPRR